ncbi:MAG TPA: tetratricopeptide repeat protein [Anaeromyxobacteraceae bacterium]|nr:tetratricopeptide repeat protein [Anaeromyxobacteraceae bacterium]
MRLRVALLACTLVSPLPALPQASGAEPPRNTSSVQELRERGDALRKEGDYAAALQAYEAARAAGGDSADVWKRIGWTMKAMRRFAEASAALEKALALDPGDREARDDLASLRTSRGLRLQGWLGGTEPGTSKQAVEAQASYGGLDRLELLAGGGWTDNIFYESTKGYASGYWFYAPDSYLKADFTLRKYRYTGANRPTPDSNAYGLVPRVDLEASHWFSGRVRAGLDYQLFAPDFFYDTATRIVNHKVTGEVEVRLGRGFTGSLMAAVLRDPSPGRTAILGRPVPGAPAGTTCPNVDPTLCAASTDVVYRTELLLGGGLAYRAERWGASVRYIPNRDLDSGFSWSIVSGVELQPAERLSLDLQWILDRYATSANVQFSGKDGDIWWARARYQVADALSVGGGLKWVRNPSPRSTTSLATRNDGTLLLDLEYRTGLF